MFSSLTVLQAVCVQYEMENELENIEKNLKAQAQLFDPLTISGQIMLSHFNQEKEHQDYRNKVVPPGRVLAEQTGVCSTDEDNTCRTKCTGLV